jgi:hypothetical protein
MNNYAKGKIPIAFYKRNIIKVETKKISKGNTPNK